MTEKLHVYFGYAGIVLYAIGALVILFSLIGGSVTQNPFIIGLVSFGVVLILIGTLGLFIWRVMTIDRNAFYDRVQRK